jgi:hypothetical protein
MNTAPFGVVSHYPHENRSEHINIGIVAWKDGQPRLHLVNNLRRLAAFDPSVSVSAIRSWEDTLPSFLRSMGLENQDEQHQFLQNWGRWRFSETLGVISFSDDAEYLRKVAMMLEIVAEPNPKKGEIRESKSRLSMDMKTLFSMNGWLGRKRDDINNHLIVPRYTLSQDENIVAEFGLRNGRLHVVETIDFRSINHSQKKLEAQSKALVFDMAYELEGKPVAAYAIVAGAIQNKDSAHSVKLLNRYADHVIDWEDKTGIANFMSMMSKATGREQIDLPIGL